MNKEELCQQWNKTSRGSWKGTRLNINHALEFYLGFDKEINRCIYICTSIKITAMESVKGIICKRYSISDGSYRYIMSLADMALEDLFLDMCTDIITYSNKEKNEYDALIKLKNRYESWIKMLSHRGSGLLTEEAQRGLIGELMFIWQYIKRHPGNHGKIIHGWQGTELEPRDFVVDNTWYEIKAVGQSAQKVKIASLAQLDAIDQGYLAVYTLEKATSDNVHSVSLNDMARIVKSHIAAEAEGEFSYKILQTGYEKREEYDSPTYIIRECSVYGVDREFPALRTSQVPEAVVQAQYALSLSGIEPYLVIRNDCSMEAVNEY